MMTLGICNKIIILIVSIVFGIILFTFFVYKTNADFPTIFIVENGETLRSVADRLKEDGLLIGKEQFLISVYFIGGTIQKGIYYLEEPKSVFTLASEFATGKNNLPNVKIRIPERLTVYEITDIFLEAFPYLHRETLLLLFLNNNGKLYPDTYYFPRISKITEKNVINSITKNFDYKTKELFSNYNGSYSKEELIRIASIIELEASDYEDRRKIAGVIFNRLVQGIPLQVDVSFYLINKKNTYTLSREDLKVDHPLNTYVNIGIPPFALTSPTIESIRATVDPVKHKYIFFLSDRFNNTYFSETLIEHNIKKQKYL